ncbi:MAG: hypothetical protein QJR13_08925, partial [Bacillota bacterium]|nr:hypothetical protein [Bacillota bacterium]
QEVTSMTRWLFPLLTSLLSLVFAYFVWEQYYQRRKIHQLLWSVSFLIFAFAAFAEFYSEVWGWTPWLYRLYYVAAALLVGVMGAGTVYLLAHRPAAHAFLAYVALVGAAFLAAALRAPVDAGAFEPGITVAGKAMPGYVRAFSPLLTGPGTLALFGGAIYSWWRAGTFYNLLIAAGTAIIAGAGFAARMGASEYLYLAEMVGLAVIFLGFMRSRELIRQREREGRAKPSAVG